ncbi:MAG TPA: alpha/beta hydrolase [Rhodobiaceae bacterium]|nr:alpha/beta hydrolase [Rhodobiaceae bacterium]|tara:strand:- start:63 stop:878 length:816 start_codon:yes stop_codon:yes gene_type:complete
MQNQNNNNLAEDTSIKFLDRAITDHQGKIKKFKTAYRQQKGDNPGPGLVFLAGFKADMDGSKAEALAAWCASEKMDFLRFDYFGHGQSGGDFIDGTISLWREDVLNIISDLTNGPQIIVGSSFGGWLSLMAACHKPLNIAALVLIAPAVDMTDRLIESFFNEALLKELHTKGVAYLPSDYDEEGYPVTRDMIVDGRKHLMLEKGIEFKGPVRILHGRLDASVPWSLSLELAGALASQDVETTFVEHGDHRLSEPENIDLLTTTLSRLYDRI